MHVLLFIIVVFSKIISWFYLFRSANGLVENSPSAARRFALRPSAYIQYAYGLQDLRRTTSEPFPTCRRPPMPEISASK
jgi:hypothetical protein